MITYIQVENHVHVYGLNPDYPLDQHQSIIEFESVNEAEGFCLAVRLIEDAIYSEYKGVFTLAIYGNLIDITTNTAIQCDVKKNIETRIKQVLVYMPIAEKIIFHTY